MAELGRFCRMCGRDIGDRHYHAVYCRECMHLRRMKRLRRYNRFWLLRLGTTDLGPHPRMKNGGVVDVEKEKRVLCNERKRLGLSPYK